MGRWAGGDGAMLPSGRRQGGVGGKGYFWEYGTKGSRVITDLSTNLACGCLTSQIGRDVVLSAKYGRTQWLATVVVCTYLPLSWRSECVRSFGPCSAPTPLVTPSSSFFTASSSL